MFPPCLIFRTNGPTRFMLHPRARACLWLSESVSRSKEQTFYVCDMVLYVNVNDTDWTRLCISIPPLRRAVKVVSRELLFNPG